MNRTLIIHTGGIGDFLLTCPALQRLAETSRIHLAGYRNRVELAVAAGIAQRAHDLDDVEFSSIFATPSIRLRTFVLGYDRVIAWMRDDGALHHAVEACGVTQVQTFSGLPPNDWSDHASRYYLTCLGFDDAPPLRLHIRPSGMPHDVVIQPGSGSRRKNWPLVRFVSLAHALERSGRSIAWCLGPAEGGIALPNGARRLDSESLVELARVLAGSRLYIGNDSGITHLAAAVGCRTIAIFGPTDPRIWAPLGDNVTVVRGNPWPTVEEVLAAIESH